MTFAEISFGIESVADAGRRAELSDWLAHKVRPMFEQRVLAISEDVMFEWRLLVEDGRKARHTFSQPDLIIAATALDHGLTVVSRDVGDYRKARVPVLNPWVIHSMRSPDERSDIRDLHYRSPHIAALMWATGWQHHE